MTRPGFDAKGFQFAWDSTSLRPLFLCPRRYQYEIDEGWRWPRGEGAGEHHLIFGKLLHSVWEQIETDLISGIERQEALYRGLDKLLHDAWTEADVRFCEACGMEGAGPDECPKCGSKQITTKIRGQYWDSGDKYKNLRTLFRTIVWGFEDLGSQFKPVEINGVPAIEMAVRITLDGQSPGGEPYQLVARLDALKTDGHTNWCAETKTTKNTLGPSFWARFNPNVQTWTQSLIALTALPFRVEGVMLEAHQVQVGGSRFAREPIQLSAETLAEWKQTVETKLQEYAVWKTQNYFPLNPASCNIDSGCPFRKICSKPPSVRRNFLTAEFERVIWDPTVGVVVEEESNA